MPELPGYIVEEPAGVRPIEGVETSLTVFIGTAGAGPVAEPTELMSAREYQNVFGALDAPLGLGLLHYFTNGGTRAVVLRVPGPCTAAALVAGLAQTELVDYFGLLCLPETAVLGEADARTVVQAALAVCERRRSFLLVDPPSSLSKDTVADWTESLGGSTFGALFFPPLRVPDPLQPGNERLVGPAATVAGLCARSDQHHGVFKFVPDPIRGAELSVLLGNAHDEALRPRGVNLLRHFEGKGNRVWGNRTLSPASNEYRYIAVRRLVNYIEESAVRALRWTTFERHGDETWHGVRGQVSSFLLGLYRQGALLGDKPEQAFFVVCDPRNNTADDIAKGRLNLEIGIAPLRPAEFLVLRLTLKTAAP